MYTLHFLSSLFYSAKEADSITKSTVDAVSEKASSFPMPLPATGDRV